MRSPVPAADAMQVRAFRLPAIFIGWLAGALFGLPFVLAGLDVPQGVADLVISGAVFLPVCWFIVARGSSRSVPRRVGVLVVFGACVPLSLAISIAALIDHGELTAVTFFYLAVFNASLFITNLRAGPGPLRSSHRMRPKGVARHERPGS